MFVRYNDNGKSVIERCNSVRKMGRKVRIFYSCTKMDVKYRDISFWQFDYVVSTLKWTLHSSELRKPIKEKMRSNFTDKY